MHQIRFRLGLRPRPCWGAYSAPPDPLAGFSGPTSKWSQGMGREGKGTGGGRRDLLQGLSGERSPCLVVSLQAKTHDVKRQKNSRNVLCVWYETVSCHWHNEDSVDYVHWRAECRQPGTPVSDLRTVLGKLLFKSNLLQLLLHFKSNKLLCNCKLLYRYFITSLKLQGL